MEGTIVKRKEFIQKISKVGFGIGTYLLTADKLTTPTGKPLGFRHEFITNITQCKGHGDGRGCLAIILG